MVTRIGSARPYRQYLKEWRLYRGLTQEQLGDRVGTGKDQISRWERGDRSLTLAVQVSLADALNILPEDLFHDPAQPSADALLRRASAEQRRMAISLIETLLKTGS